MARCGSFAELQIHPPSVPLTYKKTDGNTVDMGGYDNNEKGGVGGWGVGVTCDEPFFQPRGSRNIPSRFMLRKTG